MIGGPPINANVRPFRDARIIPFPSIARKIDETKLSTPYRRASTFARPRSTISGLAWRVRKVGRIYSTGNASSSYLLGRGEDEPTPANSPLESKHATLTAEKGMNNTRARGEPDRVLSISRRFSGIVPRSGTVGGTRTRTTSLHRLRWIHDEVQRTCSSMRSFRFPPASLDIPRIWTGSSPPPAPSSRPRLIRTTRSLQIPSDRPLRSTNYLSRAFTTESAPPYRSGIGARHFSSASLFPPFLARITERRRRRD